MGNAAELALAASLLKDFFKGLPAERGGIDLHFTIMFTTLGMMFAYATIIRNNRRADFLRLELIKRSLGGNEIKDVIAEIEPYFENRGFLQMRQEPS